MIEFIAGCFVGVAIAKKIAIVKNCEFRFNKVVKFNDGKYAIRRGLFGVYGYKDLDDNKWRSRGNPYFKDCLGTLEQCELRLKYKNEPGDPV